MSAANNSSEYLVDRGGKIVVSLGGGRCPLTCAFCYGYAPKFKFFPKKTPKQLVKDLLSFSQDFNIVYLSGDIEPFLDETSSIEFLKLMALHANVDLLFTTRLALSKKILAALDNINRIQASKKRLLIGSVSIPALESYRRIEFGSIVPTPFQRISVLESLLSISIPTMVAVRPIFPSSLVSPEEYCRLLELIEPFSTVALGELLFLDTEGVLESRLGFNVNHDDYILAKMSFFSQEREWKVCKWESQLQAIREKCFALDLPFYMRSMPGVDMIRNYWNPAIGALDIKPIYPLDIEDFDDQLF